ncbi:hypothetical protein [Acrocarpospora sp. B8E8]|uniref:hypothetical protein n=1 Tax=Acrocarpospora sp. B8E8 TaxID=3153572 RepID=UPI00325DBD8A
MTWIDTHGEVTLDPTPDPFTVRDAELDKLAAHVATNIVLNHEIRSRADGHPFGGDDEDLPPFDADHLLEARVHLMQQVQRYDGKTIEVEGLVTFFDEGGHQVMIPFDRLKAEHIDAAEMILAARYACAISEANDISATFAGLERLRQYPNATDN